MSKKHKLAIVSPCHWKAMYGGAEYQIKLLLEVLQNHPDIEVTYLCHYADPNFYSDHYSIKTVAKTRWYSKYGSFFDSAGLYRALKQLQPDSIYQRVGGAYTGVCAYYAKKNAIRMLWHIASDNDVTPSSRGLLSKQPHHYLEKKILEYGLHRSNIIVAQKQTQADLLLQHYGRSIHTIIANFQPVPPATNDKHSNKPLVVWISNLKQLKRPDIFINMADQLSLQVKADFYIIGRPENSPWGDALLQRMNKSEAITYIGEQSQEQVHELLGRASLLVNTSDYEGFPNTFIQAWMKATPVLSLNVDLDGLLEKQAIGKFSGNTEQLAIDCKSLLDDSQLCQTMAQNARNYAIQHHSLKNAEQLIDLLIKNE